MFETFFAIIFINDSNQVLSGYVHFCSVQNNQQIHLVNNFFNE